MEQGFGLFVELFPSIGVIWVIGVRLHISILIKLRRVNIFAKEGKINIASKLLSQDKKKILRRVM